MVAAICAAAGQSLRRAVRIGRQPEPDFRRVVEQSTHGVYIRQGMTLVYANQTCANIFGYDSPEDLLAIGSVLALHPVRVAPEAEAMARARDAGEPVPSVFDVEGQRKDGRQIWIEHCAVPTEWNGQPAFQFSVLDVSERKRVELALRDSEARLRAIIEHSPALISLKDETGRFVIANRQWRESLSVPDDDSPKTIWDVMPQETAAVYASYDERVLKTRTPLIFEIDVVRHGQPKTLFVTKFPVAASGRTPRHRHHQLGRDRKASGPRR